MEHTEIENRLDSKLQIFSICSIRIHIEEATNLLKFG